MVWKGLVLRCSAGGCGGAPACVGISALGCCEGGLIVYQARKKICGRYFLGCNTREHTLTLDFTQRKDSSWRENEARGEVQGIGNAFTNKESIRCRPSRTGSIEQLCVLLSVS